MESENDSDASLNSDNEEVEENLDEGERLKIREKLATMSFEDIQKLKNKLGAKVYNATVFGTKQEAKEKPNFKRANKNRPREMSSKVRPPRVDKRILPVKKQQPPRDPRFDPLCGEYDPKDFQENYKFLHDVRKNEKEALEKELNECTDPARKKIIKFLLQRLNNQIREREKKEIEHEKKLEERQEIKAKLKKGEKPVFKKKSEKRIEELINKYEELKKTNKLQKHIEKRFKKIKSKERKKIIT